MPRHSGTSGKMKKIRRKLARQKNIPQGAVRGRLVRGRVGTETVYKGPNIYSGIKVRIRPNEDVKQALKRARRLGKKS